MRLVFGLLVFILSVYLGWQKSSPLKKRNEFYVSFNNFNLIYKNAVLFDKKSLSKIVKDLNKKDDFYKLINDFMENGSTNLSFNYLTYDEKVFILDYLKSIGKGDERSQLDYVDHVYDVIEDKKKKCFEDEKKLSGMYLKLSVLIGLMLFIVVI